MTQTEKKMFFEKGFSIAREKNAPIKIKAPWDEVYVFFPSGYLRNESYRKATGKRSQDK